MGKELRLRKIINRGKKSLEQSLVEIFGCVSLDDNAAVKRNVMKDRRQINRYFYLDQSPSEESLIEIFGCFALDHKVVKLDVIRDKKRMERELLVSTSISVSSAEWLKRVHERLS